MLEAKHLQLGPALESIGELGDLLGPPLAPNVENEGVLATPIEQIEFSIRARRALQTLRLGTLGDLAAKSEAELLACKNFGQTSLTEVRQRLGDYGMRLRETS